MNNIRKQAFLCLNICEVCFLQPGNGSPSLLRHRKKLSDYSRRSSFLPMKPTKEWVWLHWEPLRKHNIQWKMNSLFTHCLEALRKPFHIVRHLEKHQLFPGKLFSCSRYLLESDTGEIPCVITEQSAHCWVKTLNFSFFKSLWAWHQKGHP